MSVTGEGTSVLVFASIFRQSLKFADVLDVVSGDGAGLGSAVDGGAPECVS